MEGNERKIEKKKTEVLSLTSSKSDGSTILVKVWGRRD